MLLPELRDDDGLFLLALAKGSEPLLVSVMHHLGQVVAFKRIQDVEEVIPIGQLVLRQLGRKIFGEVRVFGKMGPKFLDREFVVMRHLDVPDLGLPQQVLLAGE